MKKKLLTAVLLTMTMLLAGCSGKDAGEEATGSSESINPEDYVKIGTLEGIEVTAEVEGEITEADVDAQIESELNYYVQYANMYDYEAVPDKTVVEDGDMVNIDYEGIKDGEAFAGGTAKGAYLEIGSGSFIDGFESGLVGHSVGEAVDLNLTFPENYSSTDLAGQAVVFHVTINSIHDASKQIVPEFNDEFIKDNKVRTLTNNNGGINGGISNNEPIVFRCVLKPTPSILKKQRSIDENFNNTTLEIKGRHDPCIVRRARVVIDSLVALCLLDLISINEGKKWMC